MSGPLYNRRRAVSLRFPPRNGSPLRVAYTDHPPGRNSPDLPDELFQQPFVGEHLVINRLDYNDPKRKLLQIVLKLEAFINRQEDIEAGLDLWDQDVVPLPSPS